MLSPSQRLYRKCWRKKSYRTSRQAQRVIQRIYRERKQRVYKYLCSTCGEYHLTKHISGKGKVI